MDNISDVSTLLDSAGVSPVAEDNSKMDISDVTTSLDSAGISPVAEDDELVTQQSQSPSPPQHNHNDHAHRSLLSAEDTLNEDDTSSMQTAAVSLHLDNRRIIRPEALALREQQEQRHGIERTLANSHPLMSPTGTDSESEKVPTAAANDLKCHNFPDVVPEYEHPPSNTTVATRNTLNTLRGKAAPQPPSHNKLALLRAHSPDLLSSESDADVSQMYAAVEANFQSVALIPTAAHNGSASHHKEARRPRKAPACAGSGGAAGCDDTSLDSISNHSFDDDEDLEHNLASLSPSSSLIDGLDDDDDDDDDCEGPELLPPEDYDFPEAEAITPTPSARASTNALPQYSAAEERRDSRNWQKITLPDGRTREIDMRVIEPYKRVLSHGGYLKAGGHNAIVIFCACHLPDRSRADYSYVMDNLFLYVVKTLEQLVTEDYVLIYLHGGTNRRNVPPFPWLKKCYQLLDRRLRKSLKNMYLVHPTFWIKSIVWMARPFVSAKFWRKLIYVKSLEELGTHVAVERAAIPEKVKQYDAKHN